MKILCSYYEVSWIEQPHIVKYKKEAKYIHLVDALDDYIARSKEKTEYLNLKLCRVHLLTDNKTITPVREPIASGGKI